MNGTTAALGCIEAGTIGSGSCVDDGTGWASRLEAGTVGGGSCADDGAGGAASGCVGEGTEQIHPAA